MQFIAITQLHSAGQYVLLAACVMMLLSGCARTVDRVERAAPIGSPAIVDERRIITPAGLDSRVRVISVREATVGDDLLKIEVDVECLTSSSQRFLYGFEWFDHQGMQINQPQWRRMTLRGRQRGVISEVANSPDAVDFRLHLMRGSP